MRKASGANRSQADGWMKGSGPALLGDAHIQSDESLEMWKVKHHVRGRLQAPHGGPEGGPERKVRHHVWKVLLEDKLCEQHGLFRWTHTCV